MALVLMDGCCPMFAVGLEYVMPATANIGCGVTIIYLYQAYHNKTNYVVVETQELTLLLLS